MLTSMSGSHPAQSFHTHLNVWPLGNSANRKHRRGIEMTLPKRRRTSLTPLPFRRGRQHAGPGAHDPHPQLQAALLAEPGGVPLHRAGHPGAAAVRAHGRRPLQDADTGVPPGQHFRVFRVETTLPPPFPFTCARLVSQQLQDVSHPI